MGYPFDLIYIAITEQVINKVLNGTIFCLLLSIPIILFNLILITNRVFHSIPQNYSFYITRKKDLIIVILKIILILLGIIGMFFLRKLRINYAIDLVAYRELFIIIYNEKSHLATWAWIYMFIVLLLILFLGKIVLRIVMFRIKEVFITLHMYLITYDYYNCNVRLRYTSLYNPFIFYKLLKLLFRNTTIAHYGTDFFFALEKLENLFYKYFFILNLYFLDLFTNFLTISTIFQIMPYYFLYRIIRTFLITWYDWFVEEEYTVLSLKYYYGI